MRFDESDGRREGPQATSQKNTPKTGLFARWQQRNHFHHVQQKMGSEVRKKQANVAGFDDGRVAETEKDAQKKDSQHHTE